MNSGNTALLVIDIINSCADRRFELPKLKIYFSKIRKMVPNLIDFIEKYRKHVGGLVIFTKTTPWKKEFLAENINELYTDPSTTYYSEDKTDLWQEFYLVKPQPQDLLVIKNHYDSFVNTNLDEKLKKQGIKYLVVTGLFGDGCVLASICGGFSRGYNFIILEDLIETSDLKIRQETLKKLKEYTWPIMYGKTMTSKEFLRMAHRLSISKA